jgi:hypothetical protein
MAHVLAQLLAHLLSQEKKNLGHTNTMPDRPCSKCTKRGGFEFDARSPVERAGRRRRRRPRATTERGCARTHAGTHAVAPYRARRRRARLRLSSARVRKSLQLEGGPTPRVTRR